MKPTEESWRIQLKESSRKMAALWPHILHLRGSLRELEEKHGRSQAEAMEAQRHLVGLPIGKEKKKKLFKKLYGLVEIASTLDKEELDHLIRIFEMPDATSEELHRIAEKDNTELD